MFTDATGTAPAPTPSRRPESGSGWSLSRSPAPPRLPGTPKKPRATQSPLRRAPSSGWRAFPGNQLWVGAAVAVVSAGPASPPAPTSVGPVPEGRGPRPPREAQWLLSASPAPTGTTQAHVPRRHVVISTVLAHHCPSVTFGLQGNFQGHPCLPPASISQGGGEASVWTSRISSGEFVGCSENKGTDWSPEARGHPATWPRAARVILSKSFVHPGSLVFNGGAILLRVG